jgi:ketosteroid isomerase-like protein
MKKTTILLYCLALFITMSSCEAPVKKDDATTLVKSETAKTDMSQVRSEIQTIENEWADALNKKDINALMSLYSDDAISMQDRAPSLKGKAAIQAQQEKDFAAPSRFASISFQTLDLYGTAEDVTEVGTSEEKDVAGKVTGTGKYIAVFQKKDGKYKCVREIYNRDTK